MIDQIRQIVKRLEELGNSETAAHSQRFFKTGKGEYGEGDKFLGIRVPIIRKCVREYRAISLPDTLMLLENKYHEARLLAVLILVANYKAAKSSDEEDAIYKAYLDHTRYINNWDLVDSSAEHIVGAYLFEKNRKPVYKLMHSKDLWEQRIGVMSTFHFIKKGDYSDTLAISELLLQDAEDLIHKAVGWMLREIGNRNIKIEEEFLAKHYKTMPRTMLRYAIEKFPEEKRLAYLHRKK
jgi:3-methyladenine DNA glycosylase AlkD